MIQDQNGDSKIVPSIKPATQPLTKPGRVKMRSAAQQLKSFSQDNEIIADQIKTTLTNLANEVFDSERQMVESLVGPALTDLYARLEATSPDRVSDRINEMTQGVKAHVAENFQANTTSLKLAVGVD